MEKESKKMNWKIYKYPLKLSDVGKEIDLELPRGSRILHVGYQHSRYMVWALVDTEESRIEYHRFKAFYTGDEIQYSMDWKHVLTNVENHYVLHIFQFGVTLDEDKNMLTSIY